MKEHADRDVVKVILVGQPNVGKSTLFATLSGQTVRVSNWPGTTVEIKSGTVRYRDKTIVIVDVPGLYGLTPTSLEEKIAREVILSERPDVYIVLVDSTQIERSLLLAVELLELRQNVIVLLTKWDVTHKLGIHINVEGLSRKLQVPVLPVSAFTGQGIPQLLEIVLSRPRRPNLLTIDYGVLEQIIQRLSELVQKVADVVNAPPRWIAVKILEGDELILDIVKEHLQQEYAQIDKLVQEARKLADKPLDVYIVEQRVKFVENILRDIILRVQLPEYKPGLIDKMFLHPVIGPILTTFILATTFFLVFAVNLGFPLNIVFELLGYTELAELVEQYSISGLLDSLFERLSDFVYSVLKEYSQVLAELISRGIVSNVGLVLSFIPLVMLVSTIVALIEDSGLGARMAVSLHRIFYKFGLSGRAVYPTVVALGCNVPAVLTSRIAGDVYERLQIIYAVPVIPCQARLVVVLYFLTHVIVADTMFRYVAAVYVSILPFIMYLTLSLIIRKLVFRQAESPELVMELPPLHRPKLRVIWWLTYDVMKHFIVRACTVILAMSIVMWLLLSYGPTGKVDNVEESFAAMIGKLLAPFVQVVYGVDFDTAWKLTFALINGLIAKENFIIVLDMLKINLNPTLALAVLVLVLLYVPCIATFIVMLRESRSVRYTLIASLLMCGIALTASLLTYHTVRLLVG